MFLFSLFILFGLFFSFWCHLSWIHSPWRHALKLKIAAGSATLKKASLWSSFTSVIAWLLMYLYIVQAKQAQQTSDSPEESGWMQSNSETCHFVFCFATPSTWMSPFNKWENTVPHCSALALVGPLDSLSTWIWKPGGCFCIWRLTVGI